MSQTLNSETPPRPGLTADPAEGGDRSFRWRSPLAILAASVLFYLTASGLAIRYLKFSASNQWQVVVHTVVGLLTLLPLAIYLLRHTRDYLKRAPTPVVLTGWAAGIVTVVASVSGLVLTWQGLFSRRVSWDWSQVHLVATFALVAFLGHHLVVSLRKDVAAAIERGRGLAMRGAARRYGWVSAIAAALAFLIAPLLGVAIPGRRLVHAFPADYAMPFGPERPFAPSLAKTVTNGAFDEATLAGSESCGTAGCHEDILAEWRVSAHRWASMDAGFQRVQEEMAKQNGPESTRYCGGCHDPISLFAGTKNLFTEKLSSLPGYQEGVSCLACHSVRETDVKGNAAYVMGEPPRYLFELSSGPVGKRVSDFLIRAYPKEHVARLSKKLFKTPEYCAACHKQFIDQEVNKVGWVQLQNQYDNWRKSKWNHPGDPKKTVECRECHMPLVDSKDPAAGDPLDYNRKPDDGRHRSHRFLASNQVMPVMMKIPGGEKQAELTAQWLRGEIEVPEIADKWAVGPAVAIRLVTPDEARPGEKVPVEVLITSNKVGHDFPTGPLDIIQSWVDIEVVDPAGTVIFHSGKVDEEHFIEPGSFLFKAEPVDREGNLIDRHNLWEMVGVRYRRSLFPGFSDRAPFAFDCPGAHVADAVEPRAERREETGFTAPAGGGELTVRAKLRYRKFDQYLLNFLFGKDAGLTSPITDLAFAESRIRLLPIPPAAKPKPAAAAAKGSAPARVAVRTTPVGAGR